MIGNSMAMDVIHLSIEGMTCGGCSSRLTRVLTANPHITNADISHELNSGVITTSGHLDVNDIIEIISGAGFTAKP